MKENEPQVIFEYGEDSDVLFIGLGTNEPSYVEEVDDVLLIERGMFTDQITGFRIMGIKLHGIEKVSVIPVIEEVLDEESRMLEIRSRDRKALGQTIAKRLQDTEAFGTYTPASD